MPANALNHFGQLARQLRAAKGLTMADQAERLNCSPSQISELETGNTRPSIQFVKQFADWIGADLLEEQSLVKAVTIVGNVVALDSVRKSKSQKRLYRRLNKLSPSEIRAFRSKIEELIDAG
jgi:transcriptional regulator with XRE-family HTH domain